MTAPASPAPALRGRQADSARRRTRVINAIAAAAAAGQEISPSGIARAAGVDRTFLYRLLSGIQNSDEVRVWRR